MKREEISKVSGINPLISAPNSMAIHPMVVQIFQSKPSLRPDRKGGPTIPRARPLQWLKTNTCLVSVLFLAHYDEHC